MEKRNIVDEIKPILLEMIAESGWVEGPTNPKTVLFNTPPLKRTIPKKGDRKWLNNEVFTFEIVDLEPLYFITKVFPGEEEIRDTLFNTLSGLSCLSKPRYKMPWINHIGHKMNFTAEDFIGKEKDEIKEMLKEDWAEITDIVNKVEAELLKLKVEFKNTQIKKLKQYPYWHRYGQRAKKTSTKVRQQPEIMFPQRSVA